ncbi:MAG: protein kinase domain-containing protein [Hyalangium sp.]|uniref:serine/threonine protein kinase n=1 Tax=Hyalangium sp. TaxID=2028555 RepID=UPI003899F550
MTLPAGSQIGKYVVQKKLAEGGMAEIYLATSQGAEGFEKEVVIKRIRAFLASDPGFVDMFIAEARLASRLNHANVVQIFDFEKHEDTYYLAMEYVRGCTLWDLSKKCRDLMEPMPAVLVAHIGAEVARGLHYAHRLKVNGEPLFLVHRDVTPHNVLISFDGAVKLTDFGIAKAGNKLTSPGMLKGKFAYMSPEQSRGENVDARTDVFALGIVLWEMLTGTKLFDGDSDLAVLRSVQQRAILHPARMTPEVPEELGDVVMKALERELDARYQTASEFERALVQCVLNHARSPDDTDVSAFVRRVYVGSIPSAMALPAIPERPQQHASKQGASGPPPPGPTFVMPGPQGRKNTDSQRVVSPDEDPNASTHMLSGRGESSGGSRPSKVTTPGRPIPSVQGQSSTSPGMQQAPSPRPTEGALPSEADSEPMQYPPTVSLPLPASTEAPAPKSEPPARSKRVGLWVGLGAAALFAVVGVDAFLRVRMQGPDSSSGASKSPGTVATSNAGPPAPEPSQGSSAVPDAGKGANPGALAVAPSGGTPPSTSAKHEETHAAAPTLATGSLVVTAMPFATVWANGKKLDEVQGRKVFKLPAGTYQLRFEHPKGNKTDSVTIEPNGTARSEFRAPHATR